MDDKERKGREEADSEVGQDSEKVPKVAQGATPLNDYPAGGGEAFFSTFYEEDLCQ